MSTIVRYMSRIKTQENLEVQIECFHSAGLTLFVRPPLLREAIRQNTRDPPQSASISVLRSPNRFGIGR